MLTIVSCDIKGVLIPNLRFTSDISRNSIPTLLRCHKSESCTHINRQTRPFFEFLAINSGSSYIGPLVLTPEARCCTNPSSLHPPLQILLHAIPRPYNSHTDTCEGGNFGFSASFPSHPVCWNAGYQRRRLRR